MKSRIEAMSPFIAKSSVQFLFVVPQDEKDDPYWREIPKGNNVSIAFSSSKSSYEAFEIQDTPASVILYEDRVVYAEAGPQSSQSQFEKHLNYVSLMGKTDAQ